MSNVRIVCGATNIKSSPLYRSDHPLSLLPPWYDSHRRRRRRYDRIDLWVARRFDFAVRDTSFINSVQGKHTARNIWTRFGASKHEICRHVGVNRGIAKAELRALVVFRDDIFRIEVLSRMKSGNGLVKWQHIQMVCYVTKLSKLYFGGSITS